MKSTRPNVCCEGEYGEARYVSVECRADDVWVLVITIQELDYTMTREIPIVACPFCGKELKYHGTQMQEHAV